MKHRDFIYLFLLAFFLSLPSGLIAKDMSRQFKAHVFNGTNPSFASGTWSFALAPRACSATKYGNGRGESHCLNGNLSSRVQAPKTARPGQTIEYYWRSG